VSAPAEVRAGSPPAPRTALLALVALLLCLQGARGLYEPDEGRYSAVAWQMVKSGDWFTPRLAPELPHFTKPPLTYWVLASGLALLGRNEWALRLPMGLAGVLTVVLTYALAQRLVPRDPLLAATVQATSLLPFVAAHIVTTDGLLAFCETLGVLGFVAACWDAPPPRWAAPLSGLGFGLAFLTKGPPGLLPLLPIVVFAIVSGRARALRLLGSPVFLACFAVIALPWFLLQVRARPDLLAYLLGSEVQGRMLGAQLRNPGWRGLLRAFAPLLLLGPLPWSAVALRRRRAARAEPVGPPAKSPDAAARSARFLWLWLALPLVVFCIAQSRQPLYLVPLTVPASLLLARAIAPRWRWSRRQRAWVAGWALVLLLLGAAGAFVPSKRDGRRFAAALAALLPAPPRVLVFVDRQARYSPEIYLGCDVAGAWLLSPDLVARDGPAYRPRIEPLARRLARRQPGTVWLVPAFETSAWQAAVEGEGWRVRQQGTIEGLAVFTSTPPGRT
jgi:4-amino-4-deoxy-L-arabinose transferase-like glycosyltransferase